MQIRKLQKWEASGLVWDSSLSRLSRIWHTRSVIPLRCNGKSVPAEQWGGLNNTLIINTWGVRTFLTSCLKFCPPALQSPQFKFWSQPEWRLLTPPTFWAGCHMYEMRNGKTPCQTNQRTKPCPLWTSQLEGDYASIQTPFILCLARWQCKCILKSIACCWPAANRRSGHT